MKKIFHVNMCLSPNIIMYLVNSRHPVCQRLADAIVDVPGDEPIIVLDSDPGRIPDPTSFLERYINMMLEKLFAEET